jgi:hypothetical protein
LDIALLTITEMADLRGHPVLHIRHLGKSVRDLESLKLSNDLGSASMLVKVDNSDATVAILLRLRAETHLLGGRVANVDKCQVGQVHAKERQARRNVVVESCSQDLVVLGRLDQILKVLEHVLALRGDGIPSLSEATDSAAVETADDSHKTVVVVELKTLVSNLDPLLDNLSTLLDLLLLEDSLSDEVGKIS